MEGYDAKFDPPLDKRLECPICLLAQREPMQTPCGHRFCSSCILRALGETGPRCPVDNTRVSNHQLFKDNFAKREVLSLNVKCSAEECGCPWHGELRSLEVHVGMCELVHMECPNTCGHFCQRKSLGPHLVMCMNKPEQCAHCSIHYSRNRMHEHTQNCSGFFLPESVQSNIMKSNEVLKWCGTLKLKVNSACSSVMQQAAGSIFQVSGYLTAEVDSQESFLFTGNWTSSCSVMPLNAPSAKIFWRTLHSREVQTKTFCFGLLANDSKSTLFFKILKKKLVDMSAVLGLRLKSGRSRNDLTIIYFYWSEPKRRLMACVTELKSHLVKQLQNRLHVLHNPQRGRPSNSDTHLLPRSQSHSRSQSRATESRSQARPQQRPHHHTRYQFPLPPPPPPGHIQHVHPHLHPAHPAAAMALLTPAPAPPPQPHHHHHHHIQQQQAPPHLIPSQLHHDAPPPPSMGHPRFLSWQMSQSLNGYPWRVQAGSVPYFSFPSTPPTFLPSNPLPYTFAPVPPFSINQIAQVPSTAVPVPSYAGIAVQGAVVDSMVPGPNGAPFPVAAIPSLADVSAEHLHNVPPGAVAVTITSANAVPGQPSGATVVIQQSVMHPSQEAAVVHQNQDMAVLHTIGGPPPPHAHYHTPAHIGPALIAAEGVQGAGLVGGEGVAVGRYHGSLVTPLTSQLVPPQHNIMGVSLDYSVTSTDSPQSHRVRMLAHEQAHNMDGGATSRFPRRQSDNALPAISRSRMLAESRALAMMNDGAGPSRSMDSDSASDNDSMDSNSPGRNFASIIYGVHRFPTYDNDSDDLSEAAIELESNDSMLHRHGIGLSPDSQMSSDADESSSPSSVSDTSSPTNPSTIRHISSNAATRMVSPVSDLLPAAGTLNSADFEEDGNISTDTGTSSDEPGPLSLPVLINLADSDTSLVSTSPASVIDLTTTDSRPSESNTSPPSSTNMTVHVSSQSQQMGSHSYGETAPPSFLPIINHVAESAVFRPAQQSLETDGEVLQVISRHESARHYGAPVSLQRQVVMESNIVESQEVQLVNHGVVQITQPHSHGHASQIYAQQGQLGPGHTHIIQQQPLHAFSHHAHEHAAQQVFPGYSAHLPLSSEIQQVSTLPPLAAPVLPLEPAVAMGSNVHVLSWQPALSQPQHHPAELIPSHHSAAAIAHQSSGFTAHQHQGVESLQNHGQQVPTGNFWETVMPSLDMSLQGNGVTSSESGLQ